MCIRDRGYRYPSPAGYVEAVKEANYRFTPGKSYAIMGRSGSGKTTLMSVMAGLDVPWKGEVLFNGASVAELDRHKYRRDNIGMIFQSFYLLPQLTARENVELSLELCGYAGDKKTVSYTHLDVYKRQGIQFAVFEHEFIASVSAANPVFRFKAVAALHLLRYPFQYIGAVIRVYHIDKTVLKQAFDVFLRIAEHR